MSNKSYLLGENLKSMSKRDRQKMKKATIIKNHHKMFNIVGSGSGIRKLFFPDQDPDQDTV